MMAWRKVAWWLWAGLWLAGRAVADPIGLQAYDFRYLPQLRTGAMHLASSADPSGGNDDRGHFLRREGNDAVLLETHQPGMICRIWSANPHGRLKIFFDGEAAARINLPFARLAEPGPETPSVEGFVSTAGGGVSCWYPMPFAKSCKVVVEGAQQLYYQVNYCTWPPGTAVETYTTGPPGEIGGGDWGREAAVSVTVPPGEGRTLFEQAGPATLRRLLLELAPHTFAALRPLRLQMFWDGAGQPSVDAPLLDFFGAGLGAGQYLSAPVSVAEWRWFQSDWPLPFARQATIRLINAGSAPVTVRATAYTTAGRRPDDGYFHAASHTAKTVAGKPHRIAAVTGRGHYVGAAVTLFGKPDLTYLEGDETIIIDGAERLQGTGTEDFFDGAWFFRHGEYAGPFAGAPTLLGGKTAVAAYRWQIGDAVPFRKSLDVLLEHGPGNDQPGLVYRSVGFWYGEQPQPVPAAQVPAAPPPWTASEPGALLIEGESLADQVTLEHATAQVVDDRQANVTASGGKLLLLTLDRTQPARITLPVRVTQPGVYDVSLRLAQGGPDPGWTVTLDGQPFAGALMQAGLGVATWPLGRVFLEAGEHPLTISGQGTEHTSTLGLDTLRLAAVGQIKGALEAESLTWSSPSGEAAVVVQTSAVPPEDAVRSTDVVGGAVPTEAIWSGGGQVRFAPDRAGAYVEATFPIDEYGPVGLSVGYMRGPDYGLFDVRLDGQLIGRINGQSDLAQVGSRTGLGVHWLQSGDHVLRFTPVAGKDRVRAVGIDYFLIQPIVRAQEAEFHVRDVTGPAAEGVIKERFGAEPRWSGGGYLSFPPASADRPVELAIFAPRNGRYNVTLTPARIPGGGLVKARLGGATGTLDCGAPGEALGEPIVLEAGLHRGSNKFTLWSETPGAAIALDCLTLELTGGAVPVWPGVLIVGILVILLGLRKRKGRKP